MARLLCGLALAMLPGTAHAQAPAHSFEQLGQALAIGQTIVVTNTAGKHTTGRVAEVTVTPPSLVIVGRDRQTFPADTITEIRRPDRLWNGALMGAGVGLGLATWDYLIDPSEPGNGAIFAISIGVGTAIGTGIDRLRKGGRLLYRSGGRTTRFGVAPLLARRTHGLVVISHF